MSIIIFIAKFLVIITLSLVTIISLIISWSTGNTFYKHFANNIVELLSNKLGLSAGLLQRIVSLVSFLWPPIIALVFVSDSHWRSLYGKRVADFFDNNFLELLITIEIAALFMFYINAIKATSLAVMWWLDVLKVGLIALLSYVISVVRVVFYICVFLLIPIMVVGTVMVGKTFSVFLIFVAVYGVVFLVKWRLSRNSEQKEQSRWRAKNELGAVIGVLAMCSLLWESVWGNVTLIAIESNSVFQYDIGRMYSGFVGIGAVNEVIAERFFASAAELGNADAQYMMGVYYALGEGGLQIKQNEAVKFFEMAAEQNNDGAQYMLGVYYELGEGGLPVDLGEAKKFYELSADQGNENAKDELKRMERMAPMLGRLVPFNQ